MLAVSYGGHKKHFDFFDPRVFERFAFTAELNFLVMKYLLLLCLFFIQVSLSAQVPVETLLGNLRARQIGPATTSGRISSIDAVHSRPEIIYVGTAGGGVWKTNSGGASFTPVFDEHIQAIGKIAIDQQHPDTVWVGTGEPWVRNSVSPGNGIYRSVNGGKTWEHLGLNTTERISDILIHPVNPDIVYVAAQGHLWNSNPDRGVYKTTDGGKSWQKILYIDEHTGAADLSIDPQNPDILYAAMWSHQRYPDFFDSGLNGKSGLYKTTDGGIHWELTQNGLPKETLGRMAVAVAPSNSSVVYLSVECKSKEGKGLYLSTDAGASWNKVSSEFNTTVRPFYFSHIVVDPKNDSIALKAGLSLVVTENRGKSFRPMDGSVHSDVHTAWIDPNNTRHILIGTDGGVYESFDRGYSFKMFMNLPVGQFYHVSTDHEIPYNVYGGLQDNGSWYAPSQKPGGIGVADWKPTFGGDGFWSFPHPSDATIVFSEYQGGNLVRFSKKTGMAKEIRPIPDPGEPSFRFNWNAPVHLSASNPNRMYFGAQYLFRSEDMGDTWTRISPDLTTNDPKKLRQKDSGGLSIDNSGAENHCTIYSIAESPINPQVIWVGTDDGYLQVSSDGGSSWSNVVKNITGLPANTWVAHVEPSHFEAGTAYVAFDGHRTGDTLTYLFRTTDFGKTWKPLSIQKIEGYAFVIREDLVNPDLLFVGTERGLFVSVDSGNNWGRFSANLPKVAVHDMVIHPRDHALVLATHGRGIAIIDDITPLRQLRAEVLKKPFHFFESAPVTLRDPGAGAGWFGGSGNYVGPNPSAAAQIRYYMSKRHTFGKMQIEVWKDNQLLKVLPAGKSAGINIVEMPTTMERPKSAPTRNMQAIGGSLFGPNLDAGTYEVKVIKDKSEYRTSFTLMYDTLAPYTIEERQQQRVTTMKLYELSERLAYVYAALEQMEKSADSLATLLTDKKQAKLRSMLTQAAREMKSLRESFVATDGDGYIDQDERLREQLADVYRQVSTYPGKPTQAQIRRTETLETQVSELEANVSAIEKQTLPPIQAGLEKWGMTPVCWQSKEAFLKREE